MTRSDIADLARLIRRTSLALPLTDPAQPALQEAHTKLMERLQSNTPHAA